MRIPANTIDFLQIICWRSFIPLNHTCLTSISNATNTFPFPSPSFSSDSLTTCFLLSLTSSLTYFRTWDTSNLSLSALLFSYVEILEVVFYPNSDEICFEKPVYLLQSFTFSIDNSVFVVFIPTSILLFSAYLSPGTLVHRLEFTIDRESISFPFPWMSSPSNFFFSFLPRFLFSLFIFLTRPALTFLVSFLSRISVHFALH